MRESQSLIVLRYAVKMASCDCCDDRTLHMAAMDQHGHFFDIQLDETDLDEFMVQVGEARAAEDEYIIPPVNGTAMIEMEWHNTLEGDRRIKHRDN